MFSNIRSLILGIFIFISSCIFSKAKGDLGLLIGGTYYLGDLNPTGLFRSPGVTCGLNYRYNINQRYVVKASFNWLMLSASDALSTDKYQQFRNNSFASNAFDLTPQFEFNFLPLKFAEHKRSFTPFISTGLGFAAFIGSSSTNKVVLPFTLGGRFALGNMWSIGFEWNARKLFSDKIDNQTNIGSINNTSMFYANDWYYFAGVFVAVRLFANKIDCPVYN